MGQEIASSYFTERDFQQFDQRLRQETALLEQWFQARRFADEPSIAGFELEAWLVDRNGQPAPLNQPYLARLNQPLVVPELSLFNVEFNTPEQRLEGDALSRMRQELTTLWQQADQVAAELGAGLAMIGILPTVRPEQLGPASMTPRARYQALSEQILRQRRGRPPRLDIAGGEPLHLREGDMMLEAAATSFQLHLQVRQAQAAAFFNTALILSAPMVAATANSPYLFGRELWQETRIPLFEQAVAVGDTAIGSDSLPRVTFGSGYLRRSLLELFQENLHRYPPLLPECSDQPADELHHLRLHNGTIWRWNRPLIGFNRDGVPHLRIEHRVVPAGPSLADTLANAALFYGLIHALVEQSPRPDRVLPFTVCRANFYAAARAGLATDIVWLDGHRINLRRLLLNQLLPLARQGLAALHLRAADIDHYLGIIQARIESGQTGARWQRDWVAHHGRDLTALTLAYLHRQRSGLPVHAWSLHD
jgi:gamma-glutamyl:cysteine ligase YbdK (ATP-grasp superfamily)